MPNSLQPHGLQCSRLPCPSLSPKLCLNSRPVILMTPSNHLILCHPLLVPQSFLTSGSFPMSRLFISGGQSTVASASVLPMNIQGWFLFTTTFNLIPLLATSPKEIIMNGLKGSSIKLFLMVWEEKIMEKKKLTSNNQAWLTYICRVLNHCNEWIMKARWRYVFTSSSLHWYYSR